MQISYANETEEVPALAQTIKKHHAGPTPEVLCTIDLAHAVAGAIKKYLEAVQIPGAERTRFLANSKKVLDMVLTPYPNKGDP